MTKAKEILDTGCGIHPKNLYVKDKLSADIERIFALSESTRANLTGINLDGIRDSHKKFTLEKIAFKGYKGDFHNLNEKLGQFDGILLLNPAPNQIFYTSQNIVKTVMRLLKENGVFVFTTDIPEDELDYFKRSIAEKMIPTEKPNLNFNSKHQETFSQIYQKA